MTAVVAPVIPSVAHIVWLGGQPMPVRHQVWFEQNCLRLAASGITVCLWDEVRAEELLEHFPAIEPFFRYAMARRGWAFASDAIKMMALAAYGGWVLDADNEVTGDLQAYASHGWVSGFEQWGGALHPITAAMGAMPGHSFTAHLLEAYQWTDPEILLRIPNTQWISGVLFQHGATRDNVRQYLPDLDVTIYPADVFCGQPERTDRTVVRHHFAGSWL